MKTMEIKILIKENRWRDISDMESVDPLNR